MSWFTPEELPDNKYFIFGKDGAKNLAEAMNVPLLAQIPLIQSVREAGDVGRPAALQTATVLEKAFETLTQNVVQEVVRRNRETMAKIELVRLVSLYPGIEMHGIATVALRLFSQPVE